MEKIEYVGEWLGKKWEGKVVKNNQDITISENTVISSFTG